MTKKYESYAEASKAARQLGFTSVKAYKAGYRQDPGLSSQPFKTYFDDWVDWYDFLGKRRPRERFYATYAEASEAARQLGFTNVTGYQAGYRQDPKLPCNPDQIYGADWVDWYDFLGNRCPSEIYATHDEASRAARALGFNSQSEYQKGYTKDPKLPSRPRKVYSEDWLDWFGFLGKDRSSGRFYATYTEASEAAWALGLKSQSEYKKGYTKDPKLPFGPNKVYSKDWVDWYDFLGKDRPGERFYATYAEASGASRALGLKSHSEYQKGYTKNSKLPSRPYKFYAKDWVDWYDFLGKDRPGERFYATYAEASEASRALGLKSQSEYQKGYKKDPKLPSIPFELYADDWVTWYDFLGKDTPSDMYATHAEASEAAQRLGFKNAKEYRKGYFQDPRLPCGPNQIYAEDWVNWPKFLGNDRAFDPELIIAYPRFWEAIQKYVEAGTNQVSKHYNLRAFLRDVVGKEKLLDDPGVILSKDIPFNERVYKAFVEATGDTQKKPRHNICVDFFDWVLNTYCSDEDDEGVLVPIPGYRNPLRSVLKGYLDQLPSHRRSESNKPPLPMEHILRAKRYLIPEKARTFGDLHKLHSFLEDCWFEVDPELVDEDDSNCIFRKVTKERKKADGKRFFEEAVELWSPVKIVANYTIFSMPLRGQQILWLDSGEGDDIIPVWRNDEIYWVRNTSKLAVPKRNQGFLRRGENNELSSFITTNKTGKKLGGYHVPFMPDDLAYWVIQLREWQIKYNPIEELTPWTKIRLRHRTNKKILMKRGRQSFLFRDPASLASYEKVSPMYTTTAFSRTVPALLFHIQRPGEELAEKIQKKNSVDYRSPFTPHALRVSLITAYLVDGRAPITVISKLVGHASLVMTLYYTRVGYTHMSQELAAAEKRALDQSIDRYQDLILQKKIDQARPELIATDRTTMDQCLASDWPAAAFQLMNIGLCPMGGARCDEGGEVLVKRQAEAIYSPVPSGYLGTRNCPRCRFFITGPAFLGGLTAIANEVILEMNVVRDEYHGFEKQRQILEDERYDTECAGKPFENEKKLKKITAAYEERAKKLDVLACDLQHFYRLITQSIELLNKTETDKHQLIVSDQYVEMGMHLAEQQSDFRLLAEVCANAEIYESASAARAQPLLSQMLDKLADTNGIAPAMFRLNEGQQLKAANQVVKIIMKSTQSDWHLADQLMNGQVTLEELAEPLRLGDIRKEIESVMNEYLTFPLGIENCNE